MANLSDDLVQRFLVIISDMIQDKISAMPTPGGFQRLDKIIKLEPSNTNGLMPQENIAVNRLQHELLSLNYVVGPQVSYDLFSDNKQEHSRNFGYTISHNIIIDLPDGSDKQRLYYFNIDKLNSTHAKGKNRNFFIKNLKITNKSKDVFTTNSNYQVTLEIAFKHFDDLLDDLVEVESVEYPGITKRIPLIKILYRFFDKDQTQLSNEEMQYKDPWGLYLNQVLVVQPHIVNKFKSLTDTIDTNEIHRTFHLTFLKHEFEVFKSEEPIQKEYENKLRIDFISYEADPTPKIGKNDSHTPSLSDNLVFNRLFSLSFKLS